MIYIVSAILIIISFSIGISQANKIDETKLIKEINLKEKHKDLPDEFVILKIYKNKEGNTFYKIHYWNNDYSESCNLGV